MTNTHKIHTDDKWETRELGASEEHVRKLSHEDEKNIDDALNLQLVSIRLQKSLIEEFKNLAKSEGIGYQPFIRQVLTNYINKNRHARHTIKYAGE
jgi:predicted DNA binding CopG/RHH family protein